MRRLILFSILAMLATASHAAPSCKNIAVTTLTFSAYNVYAGGPVDSAATLTYGCPPPTSPMVTIDAGLHSGGSIAPRYMLRTPGTDLLGYNVYVDAARTVVWGATQIAVPTGNGQSVQLYGRVFAGQDVAVGTYNDTLTVTFNF